MEVVNGTFRPEFLNRFDEIVLSNKLSKEHMAQIVNIQLKALRDLLFERKILIEIDFSARGWLAERGCNPIYGVRPLKRVIQRELQTCW